MVTIDQIQAICKKFRGVTEDIKWENHLCFNIGDKMFLVTAPDAVPVSASFKVSDEEFDSLRSRPGFMPAPYLARYKWVHVDDIKRLSKKQWEHYAEEAYALIAAKLPAKTKKTLGLK
jgi:predicted DNA-binding protein (MmcQ/YjbR family)